jgi:hypothetical protein
MKAEKRRFQLHDKVHWRSQAGGSWTSKCGTIVAVVPPGEKPENYCQRAATEYGCIPPKDFGRPRIYESYVILVLATGARKKHRLYLPRVTQLELQSEPLK